jgi:dTDP-glucose 4,6-dehydratase
MRLLVTGGAGFIGSNFVRRVIDGTLPGFSSVVVLDKLTYAGTLTNLKNLKSSDYEFIQGDICDADLLEGLLRGFDVVINFAAESHVDRSIAGAKDFIVTNVLGVQTLLDSVRNSSVQTFIQISTDEVYGSINKGSWPETDPLLPNSPYAASKASGDLLARSYQKTHSMDIRITRCSNNYGPNQFPEKVIPLFVTNLIEGKKIPVYGTGINIRDWLHVDDHCSGVYKALMKGKAGEIYNIGGGQELTNLELAKQILSAMNKTESEIEYVQDRKGHDLRYSVDWSKALKEIGYSPQVNFAEGLLETINWYEENESWWRPVKNK